MSLVIYGLSDIGKVRRENQDSYFFDIKNQNNAVAVVCDGMGGVNGGKTASLTAVNTFASVFSDISDSLDIQTIKTTLNNAIEKANLEIYNKAKNDPSLIGMGTTLVACFIDNKNAYFVNIGDSRAYLLRDDKIRRISKDHSAVQELLDKGLISEKQARNHPNKNIITRALGVSESVEYDLFIEQLQSDDIIILCTDGVTNYLDDLEIPFEILKLVNIESAPQKLIELANVRGGADNSTIVVIKI